MADYTPQIEGAVIRPGSDLRSPVERGLLLPGPGGSIQHPSWLFRPSFRRRRAEAGQAYDVDRRSQRPEYIVRRAVEEAGQQQASGSARSHKQRSHGETQEEISTRLTGSPN